MLAERERSGILIRVLSTASLTQQGRRHSRVDSAFDRSGHVSLGILDSDEDMKEGMSSACLQTAYTGPLYQTRRVLCVVWSKWGDAMGMELRHTY